MLIVVAIRGKQDYRSNGFFCPAPNSNANDIHVDYGCFLSLDILLRASACQHILFMVAIFLSMSVLTFHFIKLDNSIVGLWACTE